MLLKIINTLLFIYLIKIMKRNKTDSDENIDAKSSIKKLKNINEEEIGM